MPDDRTTRAETLYSRDLHARARLQAQALLALRSDAGPAAQIEADSPGDWVPEPPAA